MAKCSVCNARKGKRQCSREKDWICAECCGATRKAEHCQGCGYYRESRPKRHYADVPRFSTKEMESDLQLQSCADSIEGALCLWDCSHEMSLRDSSMLGVVEMLIDKYYYHELGTSLTDDSLLQEGYDIVNRAISEDMADVLPDTLVRILGVIHFVAQRRTRGGREHFDVLQQYVGLRLDTGTHLKILPNNGIMGDR